MSDERRLTDPFKDDLRELVNNVSAMRSSLGRIEEKMTKVDDHHRTLYGVNGEPGLTIVVDRLDQVEKSRIRNFAVIYTAIVGIGLKAFWGFLTGGK